MAVHLQGQAKSGDEPRDGHDDLDDENRSGLSTSVAAKRVKGTPSTRQRASNKVEQPKEGKKPTDGVAGIPEEEQVVLVTETVEELGGHGHDGDDHGKDKRRRRMLVLTKLHVDVVGHDTKNHAREEELDESQGEHKQVGGGKLAEPGHLGQDPKLFSKRPHCYSIFCKLFLLQ